MKNVTKEKFTKALSKRTVDYTVPKHIDEIIKNAIKQGYDRIHLTDLIQIRIKTRKPKNFKNPHTGTIQTSEEHRFVVIVDNAKLADALKTFGSEG